MLSSYKSSRSLSHLLMSSCIQKHTHDFFCHFPGSHWLSVSKETCRDSEITKCPASHQACYTHTHNHFTALFPGPPGWAGARRELLDSVVQGKIDRGRHTDHLDGRHSIRTNQCPPPASHFMQAGCPSCHPTNCVKALKASMLLCQKPQLRLKY